MANAATPLPEEATVHYVTETKGSAFVVQAFATGLFSAFGHNPKIPIKDFRGDVQFVRLGGSLESARLHLTVPVDSLEVGDDIKESDRQEMHRIMREEVLEIERFPEIIYECSHVRASGNGDRYWVSLNGELTLHGVTRIQPVSAKVVLNGDSLLASGDFSLRQSDFGISTPSVMGGTIRIKDELKLMFNIVARRQG